LNQSDIPVVVGLIVFSVIGIFYCIKALRDFRKPEIIGRFTAGGLRGAKIYYSVALSFGVFMFLFLVYKLSEHFL
jgi:hypothetical protein